MFVFSFPFHETQVQGKQKKNKRKYLKDIARSRGLVEKRRIHDH